MEAIIRNAEASYHDGMRELRYGRPTAALEMFKRAITISGEATLQVKRRARYFSYCGLCLHHAGGSAREVLRLCRRAVKLDPGHPALWRNLAYVANITGRRSQAYSALDRAITINPGHPGVLGDLRKLGVRRRPVLFFLPRSNPINVMLGRIRASVAA